MEGRETGSDPGFTEPLEPPTGIEIDDSADSLTSLEMLDEEPESAPVDDLRAHSTSLSQRCRGTSVEVAFIERNYEEGVYEAVQIKFPAGRHHRSVVTDSLDRLRRIEDSSFEKCRFIDGYEAIWSPDLRFIEALLTVTARRSFLIRLSRLLDQDIDSIEGSRLSIPSPNLDLSLTIGEPSDDFKAISGSYRFNFIAQGRRVHRPTFRIDGIRYTTHDNAKQVLEKIGKSLLFHIDVITNESVQLSPSIEFRPILGQSRSSSVKSLRAPNHEYDQEALSLYWYARSSANLPLLRFLALYQVLEFYFPIYMEAESGRMIRNMLRNPLFNLENDSDISRIIMYIKSTFGNRGLADERSQLRSSISSCVTEQDLREFIQLSSTRAEFLASREGGKLSKQRIILDQSDPDLFTAVARRIYEIRCRIVHTKGEGDVELLLPSSSEVRSLYHDIALLEFLAQRFIIAGGKVLQLPSHTAATTTE